MALASFTIGGAAFLSGTSVAVFPAEAKKPGQAPVGLSVTSATAGSSSVALSGLAWATRYVAYALQAGVHRYVDFKTDEDPSLKPASIAYVDAQVGSDATLGGVHDITASPYNATVAATDNTAAIQAAINDAKLNGGIVYVPPGVFKYASPLNLDNSTLGFAMVGATQGAMGHTNMTPSELKYTGSTAPAISCHSVHGFALDGLRFTYDNASFTGDLIDLDGNPLAADCTNWTIRNCSSRAVGAGITARSIVRLNKAITGSIQDCHLTGGINSLRMGDPGGSYVVGVAVERCTFNFATDAHVLIGSADAEAISFDACIFEAGTSTPGIRGARTAIDGGNCVIYGFSLSNSWFGDAGAQTNWVQDLYSQGSGPIVIGPGNRFASVQSTAGNHLSGGGTWLIFGNHFENGNVFSHTTPGGAGSGLENIIMFGNYFAAINAKVVNATAAMQLSEWANAHTPNGGNPATAANIPVDGVARGRFSIRNTTGAQPTDSGDTTEHLSIGAFTNAMALGAPVNKGQLLVGPTPNPTALRSLMVIAPALAVTGAGGFSIWAGLGQFNMLEVQGSTTQALCKLGFNGATPVVQPTRAGQLTDSTGGTVSGTLAAGIADAVAKNAIASLAAKVNALETIIHNYGLST